MADAGQRAGDQHRRQRSRENEARRIGADHIDDVPVSGDIAAHHAERLAKRPFDDRQPVRGMVAVGDRSEEHTSELQSLMRISYAVFCLKKKTKKKQRSQWNTTMNQQLKKSQHK